MRCITGARFNMKATVLNRTDAVDVGNIEDSLPGHYETIQDEDTGGLKRVWVEAAPTPVKGKTPDVNAFEIDCIARGFTDLGFRSSANTQSFDNGVYKATEVIQITYPARYILNRRQLITNIKNSAGTIVWLEEETGQATVFEVQGVTPGFDPFSRHLDNTAVLKRAAIQ